MNLYGITTNQAAIALFRVVNRYAGNLPPMPGVFPDCPTPLVRCANGERELAMMLGMRLTVGSGVASVFKSGVDHSM